jgi:hypothetical protein
MDELLAQDQAKERGKFRLYISCSSSSPTIIFIPLGHPV